MKTIEEWREYVCEGLNGDSLPTLENLRRIEEALAENPNSCTLWCLKAELYQIAEPIPEGYQLQDSENWYKKAIQLDPKDPEPLESIGYFLDCVMDDPKAAEPYFRKAISLGAGKQSVEGLLEVLKQLDENTENDKVNK